MINKTEQNIMQNWKDENDKVLVSICCVTYNHESYISSALDGFLMQETTFPFEILIRDDCSTDNTAEIIQKYVKKYPAIIKPIFEKENQFSKGIRPMPILYKKAVGRYVALCEGDDYWTDPLKLQKQINLLTKYPESSMSIAYTDVYKNENNTLIYQDTFTGNGKTLQYFEDIVTKYFHTSTYVLETQRILKILDYCEANGVTFSDTVLRYLLIVDGPFVLLPEVVSVYRITGHGIWTRLNLSEKFQMSLIMHKGLFKLLSGKYKKHQAYLIYYTYRNEIINLFKRAKYIDAFLLMPKLLYSFIIFKIPVKLIDKIF